MQRRCLLILWLRSAGRLCWRSGLSLVQLSSALGAKSITLGNLVTAFTAKHWMLLWLGLLKRYPDGDIISMHPTSAPFH